MFFAPNATGFLWSLLTGALALFAGVVLLWHPVEGVVSLTLVLVAFFIAEGVSQMVAAREPDHVGHGNHHGGGRSTKHGHCHEASCVMLARMVDLPHARS